MGRDQTADLLCFLGMNVLLFDLDAQYLWNKIDEESTLPETVKRVHNWKQVSQEILDMHPQDNALASEGSSQATPQETSQIEPASSAADLKRTTDSVEDEDARKKVKGSKETE